MRGCEVQRYRGAMKEKKMENLNASSRAKTGKGNNRRLRSAGDMPAVIYGGEGEVTSLSVGSAELTRLLRSAHRRNTLIGLTIDGAAAEPVLVRELQADPITRELIHADFVRVDLKAPITVKVPVEMTGRAIGVLTGGGDCPGLNAVIRAVTKTAIFQHDIEVVGVLNGYEGLICDETTLLEPRDVSGILTRGGTILGTNNRCSPLKYREGEQEDGTPRYIDATDRCLATIERHGMDALIFIPRFNFITNHIILLFILTPLLRLTL